MPFKVENAKRNTMPFLTLGLGLAVVLLFFIASGFISYSNTRTMNENARLVARTHNTLLGLSEILSIMKDAETGQRGYMLTGEASYLEPYSRAVVDIRAKLAEIDEFIKNQPEQIIIMNSVKANIQDKLKELESTIELRRTKGFTAALAVVKSDKGIAAMDAIREALSTLEIQERELRAQRLQETAQAYRTTVISGILTGIFGAILALVMAFLMFQALRKRLQQEWLARGQMGLASAMLGDLRTDQLGENILKFFAEYFRAQAGAFFVKDGTEYKRVATYGVPKKNTIPERFGLNDGLLGQAAKDRKSFLLKDVPDNYLTVGSAMGQDKPRHLVITTAGVDNMTNTVIELGFLDTVNELSLQLLKETVEPIGVAVRAADYRAHLQNLLEETQRQSEELQAQSEELRVSNEELEEQSRALKETQFRLEQQQAELEQTNSQLEEQTQQLEQQRDDLSRANAEQSRTARELAQASQYKSDFLANMSHELRTPLNSSLILAKLLADNKDGNLTAEQVKFAQTIQASGNDLLLLINDILDLSKIEAGHMEIMADKVRISRISDDLSSVFKPLAKDKGIDFKITLKKDAPDNIETDRQRLEQILKNLLSNALKFTEKGSVELIVGAHGKNHISFAVKDTGIGISEEQQKAIFDAFRQADGTISRKYGGTGLGLSISRELARLLGGVIALESEPGKGSIFSVVLPHAYDADAVAPPAPRETPAEEPAELPPAKPEKKARKKTALPDDRDKITHASRSILVVEDDPAFARILYDLAHELNFLCLIAETAEEGLAIAKQYLPSAVLLDVGLPDNTGLYVLDRLKRNAHTRHIPIHVVSGNDYSQTALTLGAVGYMLKPVKREEILSVFQQLEHKMDQKMHRILLVEDDATQRESVGKLLGSSDVEIVPAATAAECLKLLENGTYDCMVLDLTLPDASGFALLKTLSTEDNYAFPPVIVYTGRELSADEEQTLRRYSKSIIIKGAKSPERLLDEVALFLHQVVSDLPQEKQKMIAKARNRDSMLEGRRILVVEDDIRNVYSLTNILEPNGVEVQIARNGEEAIAALNEAANDSEKAIDLVLMDVMMPVMDGMTATREIRKNSAWKKLPIIMLTAKAMKDDQERCIAAGANDYMAKPLDVEKLLSLVRVWMPR